MDVHGRQLMVMTLLAAPTRNCQTIPGGEWICSKEPLSSSSMWKIDPFMPGNEWTLFLSELEIAWWTKGETTRSALIWRASVSRGKPRDFTALLTCLGDTWWSILKADTQLWKCTKLKFMVTTKSVWVQSDFLECNQKPWGQKLIYANIYFELATLTIKSERILKEWKTLGHTDL